MSESKESTVGRKSYRTPTLPYLKPVRPSGSDRGTVDQAEEKQGQIDQTQQQQGQIGTETSCEDLEAPPDPNKGTTSSRVAEILGIGIDSKQWAALLPHQKVGECCEELRQVLSRKKVTLERLQSLARKLLFTAVVPARPFLARLINKCKSVRKPWHQIIVSQETVSDLRTWLSFMQQYSGDPFRAPRTTLEGQLNMATGASKRGYVATFGKHWIQERYSRDWVKMFEKGKIGIETLELYPILIIIGMFGQEIKNTAVTFHSDNKVVVKVLNKQSSSNKVIMRVVRPLVLLLMRHGIRLRARHDTGRKSVLCDLIRQLHETQRAKVLRQVLRRYSMESNPETVLDQYKSTNFELM